MVGESQAVKRKKPVSKSTLGEDAAKFLEMALAVDHTVIKFHGKQRVQQYVLTLLNIVSLCSEAFLRIRRRFIPCDCRSVQFMKTLH